MISPRLASVVLLAFVGGAVSAVAAEGAHATTIATEVNCSGPCSCPDADAEGKGQPCGPICPCACCPGHASVAAFLSVPPALEVPPFHEQQASLPNDLHPQDVGFRIFHPPRV